MNFTILWDDDAVTVLRKLPKEISVRIIDKVTIAATNPFHYLASLQGVSYYKLRIGDYRVIIELDLSTKTFIVRMIGHRKSVYKSL